jgi:farnesyl diphosphate synthase
MATAVEVVHTYSLVHDDLPCMDNDDLRRGRPTTHRQFDVATATEAGFRMVPLSARVLAAGAARLGLAPERMSAIGVELYRAAGATGMIRGQVLDLEAEARGVTFDELVELHRAKTGALITGAAVIGALAADAGDTAVHAVRAYGEELGLAFQIVDDVLDATGTSAELGKTAGKDARQRKASFVTALGLEGARRAAAGHLKSAVDRLQGTGVDCRLLEGLARLAVERSS